MTGRGKARGRGANRDDERSAGRGARLFQQPQPQSRSQQQPQPQQQQQPPPPPQQQQQQQQSFVPAPIPSTSAWGARPGGSISTAGVGRGRGTEPQRKDMPLQQQSKQLEGRGDNGTKVADRGAIRGRSVIGDIIHTKPTDLHTKRGQKGTPVSLTANYFRLVKKPTWSLYQYRVDFSPQIEMARFRSKLIAEQRAHFGGYLFDGTVLYLTQKLPEEHNEYMCVDREGQPIQITVKFVTIVSMTSAASIQVLNLILRNSMKKLDLQLVGRNFFDVVAKIDLPQHYLQLWPGYVTSIQQHERDILLCAEITTKVMRSETVLDILDKCHENRRNDWQRAFAEAIVGQVVLTTYNNKTYKINDIDYNRSPRSQFETRQGTKSFIQYYKEKYQVVIKNETQPLLVYRSTDRELRAGLSEFIALVPELCRATGLTDQMRSDFKLMNSVATYTRITPDLRQQRLRDFNQRLQNNPKSIENLKDWNFTLDKHLVEITGRTLTRETICFGDNKRTQTNADADWSREFRNTKMYHSLPLKNWVIISPQSSKRQVTDFLEILKQAGQSLRYEISQPRIIYIDSDRLREYTNALDEVGNYDPQLIMCVVGFQKADLYSLIKRKCCVDRGIPTQVMVSKTITPKHGKPLNSLLTVGTKVIIQMNCKLGGVPWLTPIPAKDLMVVGFDVCHDTTDKQKSYGALVATMDIQQSTKYFSAVSPHTNGEELSNHFTMNMTKALLAYQKEHKSLPSRIFIYRDGVGEGQTNYVFTHEIENLKKKLKEMYGEQPFRMAFIVVSKRINTRLFMRDSNPPPGTVVDDVITLPTRYDFFLISQYVKTGTVSPTNYNVLYDNLGFQPDQIQAFTYKLCHLYYNWSGTVRVPMVCQYAHKLAFLVGTHIHSAPHNILENRLYFL